MIQFKGQFMNVLFFLILLAVSSCDYKGPDALWNPGYDLGMPPVIESIEPPDVARAGITEIVINGQNFQPDVSKNAVYFGNVKVDLKEASSTRLNLPIAFCVAAKSSILFSRNLSCSSSMKTDNSPASAKSTMEAK